jgi:hypothetical protein
MPSHKNKTLAASLGLFAGALGAHRFYLRGAVDRLGLLHVTSVPLCGMVIGLAPEANGFFKLLPLLVSALAGWIEGLVLGLHSDEQWDGKYNAASGRTSNSRWPLAIVLVLTMVVGSTALIAAIARLFDLLYTGGAYG